MSIGDRAFAACVSAALLVGPRARAGSEGPATRTDESGSEHAPMVIALEWKQGAGAEGCIDRETLQREVEERLERRVFGDVSQADVLLVGQIERGESDFVARISMVAASGHVLGERELHGESPDCARLDDSLALVIALAIDSLRAVPVALLRIPKSAPREPWSARVGPTLVGSWGLVPGIGFSAGVDVSVRPPSFWPVEVVATFSPFDQRGETAGRGANFSALQLGLFLCPFTLANRVEFRGCFGVQADRLSASGFGVDREQSPSSTLVSFPVLRGVAFVPLGGLVGLSPNFSVAVPFSRDRFYYTDGNVQQTVHQPQAVMLFLGVGLLLGIP
jgi:hypothetical protein